MALALMFLEQDQEEQKRKNRERRSLSDYPFYRFHFHFLPCHLEENGVSFLVQHLYLFSFEEYFWCRRSSLIFLMSCAFSLLLVRALRRLQKWQCQARDSKKATAGSVSRSEARDRLRLAML
jgi:hypothetical protein